MQAPFPEDTFLFWYCSVTYRNILFNASASSTNADPRNPGPPKHLPSGAPGFFPGGAHFKTQRGRGGYLIDIMYDNLHGDGVSSAISFSCLHGGGPPANKTATPVLRNITVKVCGHHSVASISHCAELRPNE